MFGGELGSPVVELIDLPSRLEMWLKVDDPMRCPKFLYSVGASGIRYFWQGLLLQAYESSLVCY